MRYTLYHLLLTDRHIFSIITSGNYSSKYNTKESRIIKFVFERRFNSSRMIITGYFFVVVLYIFTYFNRCVLLLMAITDSINHNSHQISPNSQNKQTISKNSFLFTYLLNITDVYYFWWWSLIVSITILIK